MKKRESQKNQKMEIMKDTNIQEKKAYDHQYSKLNIKSLSKDITAKNGQGAERVLA